MLISDVDYRFTMDTVDCGRESVESLLAEAVPRNLLEDRGDYYSSIWYLNCGYSSDGFQIGVLPNKNDHSLVLYRYYPYRIRRWDSFRSRDDEASQTFGNKNRKISFVLGFDRENVREGLSQIFGIELSEYGEWFDAEFNSRSLLKPPSLPDILVWESQLHSCRQAIQDELRRAKFSYRVVSDGHDEGDVILHVDAKLKEHLEELDYREERQIDLAVVARTENGLYLDVDRIQMKKADGGDVEISFQFTEKLREEGNLWVKNPGAETICRRELELFNEIEDALLFEDLPAGRAWKFLEPILGLNRPGPRTHVGTWKNRLASVEYADSDPDYSTEVEQISQSIWESDTGADWWGIVTGAAGTGKTRFTAEIAAAHLQKAASRNFPPSRVLVVSAAHWGVINFLDTFLKKHSHYSVHRNINSRQFEQRRNEDPKNEMLRQKLDEDFNQRVRPQLPKVEISDVSHDAFFELKMSLEKRLVRTREMLDRCAEEETVGWTIPSHNCWRQKHGRSLLQWKSNLQITSKYLQKKLRDLEGFAPAEPAARDADHGEMDQRVRAAELVGSTIDALPQLPDIYFDLIIVEEASQVSPLGLLKIMNKVMRGMPIGHQPRLILCGDQQQLSPFVTQVPESKRAKTKGEFDPPWEVLGKANNLESIFGLRCHRHTTCNPGRIHRLTVQCRMERQIAQLVNSLFYSDEEWTTVRKSDLPKDAGVWWVDTEDTADECVIEPIGTSWVNLREREAIRTLVGHQLKDSSELLLISPYSAQVRELQDLSTETVSVRTIDSCQGIQAETVVVSLVQLSGFPVEMRRLNVALSRARNRLFLVGSYAKLLKVGTECDAPPHIKGLSALFSAPGPFAARVLAASKLKP